MDKLLEDLEDSLLSYNVFKLQAYTEKSERANKYCFARYDTLTSKESLELLWGDYCLAIKEYEIYRDICNDLKRMIENCKRLMENE